MQRSLKEPISIIVGISSLLQNLHKLTAVLHLSVNSRWDKNAVLWRRRGLTGRRVTHGED